MLETLRKFFQSIPNKIKALYLVWLLIHFILFLISINEDPYYKRYFYPFKGRYDNFFDLKSYDYSEFLIYILSPIFIYAIIYLWKKSKKYNYLRRNVLTL
jgi:hypothetical protein